MQPYNHACEYINDQGSQGFGMQAQASQYSKDKAKSVLQELQAQRTAKLSKAAE